MPACRPTGCSNRPEAVISKGPQGPFLPCQRNVPGRDIFLLFRINGVHGLIQGGLTICGAP